jgi:hypothetical protein
MSVARRDGGGCDGGLSVYLSQGVEDVTVVSEDGSPHGTTCFVLWNPPLAMPGGRLGADGGSGKTCGAGGQLLDMSRTEARARARMTRCGQIDRLRPAQMGCARTWVRAARWSDRLADRQAPVHDHLDTYTWQQADPPPPKNPPEVWVGPLFNMWRLVGRKGTRRAQGPELAVSQLQ